MKLPGDNDNSQALIDKQYLHSISMISPPPIRSQPRYRTNFIPYEYPPKPVGGLQAIQQYLFYPKFAIDQKIEGKSIIQCTISEDGKVIDHTILLSLHPVLDLISVLALSGIDWEPATQMGHPIAVPITYPITFKLDETERNPEEIVADSTKIIAMPRKLLKYPIDDKNFKINTDSHSLNLIEDGFHKKNCIEIQYGSDRMFSLLFDKLDLIKYVYIALHRFAVNGIGLVDVDESIFIKR